MTKRVRVTAIFDDDVLIKLRKKQAKLIKETLTSVSLSRVINQILRENFKKK